MTIKIILLSAALAILQYFLPNWEYALIFSALASLFFSKKFSQVFLYSGAPLFLVWGFFSAILYFTSADIIAARISQTLQIQTPWFLIIISCLLGFIVGSIGGTTGYTLKRIFIK